MGFLIMKSLVVVGIRIMDNFPFLKHLTALAYLITHHSIPVGKTTPLTPHEIELAKVEIWRAYDYAEFYTRTLEELYNPQKTKWAIPGKCVRTFFQEGDKK